MPAPAGYRRWFLTAFPAGLLLVFGVSLSARADIFRLEHGGRVEGEWLNPTEQPLTKYLVRTTAGVTLTLPLAEVREAVPQSQAERDYAKRAPMTADTPQAQWSLAEWCRQNGLARQRQEHLRRIIELEPNHPQARYALGFQFLQGAWVTRDEFHRREGYEYYRGKWRTPQEIEILETRARTELAEKDWLAKIRRWRHDLDTDKARAAYDSLVAIRDPIAVGPLGEFFARERVRSVKSLYADILAGINSPPAVAVLAERTLADPDDEIFYYCLDKLVQLKPPRVTDALVAALKDASNVRVNRAATALARLQDKSAISPMIDALITTHSQVVPNRPGTSADSTTATFGDGGTFIKKGEGPNLIIAHVQNQPVLDALTKLTGVNFGFDQRAWRYWYGQDRTAKEAAQPVVDARRQ